MLRSALIVGAVLSLPTAALTLPAFDIVLALARGGSLSQAWAATGWTDEDLEMVPGVVLGAVFFGLITALVAAASWLGVISKLPGRPGLARLAAALAAASIPVLFLVVPDWPFALAIALPVGVLAAVAAPLVGYGRRPELGRDHGNQQVVEP